MTLDVRRASTYRAAINLYVEDRVTSAYLDGIWNDPAMACLLGGGNEGVEAIVRVEENASLPNVFGVVDRDYRKSNRDRWLEPNESFRVFILPTHEIENYLLDPDALMASRSHNRNLSREEIDGFLTTAAARLCWWAACREVIAELKRRFRLEFIKDPSQGIADEGAARACICESPWFSKLASETARSTVGDMHRLLAEKHAWATACLADGTWRREFAGKEILTDVAGRVSHPSRRITAASLEDIAKDVAEYQVKNASVPPDLVELLAALKARVNSRPRRV